MTPIIDIKCGILKTNVDYDFTKIVWLAFGRENPEMGLIWRD